MPTHTTIHIYALLLEKLQADQFVSLRDLTAYLSAHDLPKSVRSVSRYIEQLRNEFGLEIVYNHTEKAYELAFIEAHEIERFLNLLKLAEWAEIPVQNYKNILDLSDSILLENQVSMKGIQYIREVLYAIQNRLYLRFSHFNYHTEKTTAYRIKPILLKQYQQRWYVIGDTKNGEYRTFGLDRLSAVWVEKKSFPKQNQTAIKKQFEQIIGLNYSESKPMKVKLELSCLQARYLEAAPLHATQYVESETEEKVIIVLHLIPNYELKQRILMMADQVKVLEPISLKKEIKQLLKSTLELYT